MTTYKIFSKNDGSHREAVKQGWSWPAFFFGLYWALYKRLWLLAILLFILFLVVYLMLVSLAVDAPGHNLQATDVFIKVLYILYLIVSRGVLGFYGNKLREISLKSRRYNFDGVINAGSPEAALAAFLRDSESRPMIANSEGVLE